MAETSDRGARVIKIFEEYNAVLEKAGPPYTLG
jgi:hypothetical protein